MCEQENMRENLPCAVVQDLMPLEIDGVASLQSGELVRTHMERCEGCRAAYDRMCAEISVKEQEQIPALRDVMNTLWRRLSVRAALAAIAAGILLCITVWILSITTVEIPIEDIVPESVALTINDGSATLRYVTIRDRSSHSGYGYRFEENPERENELTLHICNNTTLFRSLMDRTRYALTGEGTAEHEIDLGDMVLGYDAARYPQEAAIVAIVYDQNIYGKSEETFVLWQAQEDQSPLTIQALIDGYRNRFLT